MNDSFDKAELVRRYTPQLVLYPEIPFGKTRKESENLNYPDESPFLHDYHPRDIRMVLANSGFHARFRFWRRGKSKSWRKMLDRMEGKKYKRDLDILPGVGLDNRERFWDEYARIIQGDNQDYRRACYARVVEGPRVNDDRLLVQYWYPCFYNDFWNAHEMDWECAMVVFKRTDGDPGPTVCAYSAHHKGSWLQWKKVEKAEGTHPIVYVAHGSHAGYFYGHRKYVTAPDVVANAAKALNKEHRGLGDFTTLRDDVTTPAIEAQVIPDREKGTWTGDWRWLNQKGRWGSPGDWDFEFGDSGPVGPPYQGIKWDQPFRWINDSCERAPDPGEGQVPTLLEPGE